ncbi:hypothetical protein [Corynebacterium argentoratense]|uniref:hypothetical protein n=1 Tax=Corynebacterium argentoratense TaxID=42817 RepID=UPI00128BD4D9|nr:hypothetical protein [Corynebacterium argentoratense]
MLLRALGCVRLLHGLLLLHYWLLHGLLLLHYWLLHHLLRFVASTAADQNNNADDQQRRHYPSCIDDQQSDKFNASHVPNLPGGKPGKRWA